MGLVSGVECNEGAPGPVRPWSLFFESVSEATFFDFGAILGGFWEAKMVPKSIFWEVFWKPFFACDFSIDFGSFFGGSKPEK